MKKIFAIIMILLLSVSMVACQADKKTTKADQIRSEYNSFDWVNADQTEAKNKATMLISEIQGLATAEQQELKDIKTKLDQVVIGGMDENAPKTGDDLDPMDPNSSLNPYQEGEKKTDENKIVK